MKIIAGLGNPGNQYEHTRHNAGFIILDSFAQKNSLTWEKNSKFNALIVKTPEYTLVKPQTFMNKSGTCISRVLNFFNTSPTQLLIIHDEVDLEFKKIRKQFGSGSAGHHGVMDVVEKLGTQDFWRLRVGVGRPENSTYDVMSWVLTQFSNEELEFIRSINVPLDF